MIAIYLSIYIYIYIYNNDSCLHFDSLSMLRNKTVVALIYLQVSDPQLVTTVLFALVMLIPYICAALHGTCYVQVVISFILFFVSARCVYVTNKPKGGGGVRDEVLCVCLENQVLFTRC